MPPRPPAVTPLCLAATEMAMTARDQRRLEPNDTPHPPVNQRRRLWLQLICPFYSPLPLCLSPAGVQQRVKNTRLSRDRMQLDCLEQFEGPVSHEDPSRVKIRHRVRQMLSDVPAEENKALLFKGKSKSFSPSTLFILSSLGPESS